MATKAAWSSKMLKYGYSLGGICVGLAITNIIDFDTVTKGILIVITGVGGVAMIYLGRKST